MKHLLLGIDEAKNYLKELGLDEEQILGWENQFSHRERGDYYLGANEYGRNRPLALAKNNGMCVYCGKKANSVDHIIPRARGGGDNLENLAPACMDCNRRKRDKVDWVPQ